MQLRHTQHNNVVIMFLSVSQQSPYAHIAEYRAHTRTPKKKLEIPIKL